MIGKVTGRLDYRAADHVLIDTAGPEGGGVGYLVYCSERTLARMPRPGGRVTLYTDLLVREDLLQLFGFLTLTEREWHRLLISVQGVGARAALAILGTLGAEGVARALALGDAAAIRAAPGIGPKIAQRVILELRTKAPAPIASGQGLDPVEMLEGPETLAEPVSAAARASSGKDAGTPSAWSEALSALANLGYAPAEAGDAIAQAAGAGPDLDTGGLIRASLRLLAARG